MASAPGRRAVAPQHDVHSRPIRLELCRSCDTGNTDRPAVGILLPCFALSGGKDVTRAEVRSSVGIFIWSAR
ncbi:hypothetical protein [Streptomyces sp. NPDC046712]|uniref:hypothetical protein n=1 Tax=Streptomyces sp. NPDC046712 TaxID=3154802 RepID=UPI0033D06B40